MSLPASVTWLKGHSQLMHMRISYNFLADLYITRHARETESQKRVRNTLNKTCRVELVTSRNRDYSPYAVYLYTFGNSPMDLPSESQTSTNTSEFDHQKRWEMTWIIESEWNDMNLHESLSKVQGRESLICQTYVTFSIISQNIYNDYLLSNVIDSFLLLFW